MDIKTPFSDSLKTAILESAREISALASDSGVDQSQIRKFLKTGRGLSLHTLDRIASVIGLRVVVAGSAGAPRAQTTANADLQTDDESADASERLTDDEIKALF